MPAFRFLCCVAMALSLPACAMAPADPPPRDMHTGGPMPPQQMTCVPDGAQWALGQRASADVVARVKADSDASVVRVIRPGEMITMDFSGVRVDIRVDGDTRILAVTCG